MKNILGVLGGVVVLAGVWYTANLRAENQVLRDQIAQYESGAAAPSSRPAASPEAAATDSGPRILSDDARNVLLAELSAASGKKVWFVTQAKDREAGSFQLELEDAFLEAGWEIAGSSESTRSLRAGVRVFVADSVLPEHISVAVTGLRAVGLDVFVGSGYRAFFEKQKAENPEFSGVELAPDQDFVIVVGPKPPAS